MKTFLSQIPQYLDLDSLLLFDPNLDSAIRDVASSVGLPTSIASRDILDNMAAVKLSQMIHDPEEKDAFNKGVIHGLLMAAALPDACKQFLASKSTRKDTPA